MVFLMVLLCAIGTNVWAETTDYTSQMSSAKANWANATDTFGDGGVERYSGNSTAFAMGDVLTQTINDLPNGYFEVEFYAWENFADWDANATIGYGNGKAQVFANVSIEDIHVLKSKGDRAFNDANTYRLLALVTDGTLKYGVKNIAAGGNWAVCKPKSLTYLGTKVDDNTDLTFAINNYDFVNCENNAFPGWSISAPNGNKWKNGTSCVEYWIGTASDGSFDYYQTLSNLPGGKYSLSASMWNSTNDESGANFNGGGICGVYGTSSNGTAFAGVTTDSGNNALNTYTTNAVLVTDGTLRIGVKNNGTMTARWFGVDWITLEYLGSCLMNDSEVLPTTAVTADKWFVVTIPSEGNYTLSSSATATITYTQDGTQLASNVTSTLSESIAANGSKNLELNAGSLYVKSDAATTITVEVASYVFTAGQDITSIITNPGFEDNDAAVDLSSSNLISITGWTLLTADNTNDVGTRAYSNKTYASLNGEGNYCFNSYWEGKPLTQTLGNLPAGTYELSALVTTGNASQTGTVYLNAGNAHSTGYARKSANANFYHRERLVFTINSKQDVTIGIRGGSAIEGSAKKGAWNENGYWWYKCDDFKLKYLCEPTQANLYSHLSTLISNCAPWEASSDYNTNFQTYSAYTASNTVAELTTAINYITNEYPKYGMEYGTSSNPYDLGVIKNADFSDGQTSWSENRSATGSGIYSVTSDANQTDYLNSSYNTWMHHVDYYQTGIVLDEGLYRLSAKMKGLPKDDVSTFIYATEGDVNYWGSPTFDNTTSYGYLATAAAGSWSSVNTVFKLHTPKKLRIGVFSWGNNWNGGNGGAFQVDDWKIERIDTYLEVNGAVVTAYGGVALTDINAALTNNVSVLNLESATGLSSSAITTTNNPNLLIFANSGQVSNSDNVVIGGQCSSLVLTGGHPFVNPTQFTVTSASYTLSALAGNQFATLMLPFNASLPSGGTAYTLDQGVNLIDGNVRGTATASIAANSPVLVTASGNYTGSSVTVPVVAQGATFENGELVGTYTAMTAVENSYVLQNHTSGEGVAFYLVGSTKPTVGPFRAYIKPQTNSIKSFQVLFDADGISLNPASSSMGEEDVYTLSGVKVNGRTAKAGIYIQNGKKVIIK